LDIKTTLKAVHQAQYIDCQAQYLWPSQKLAIELQTDHVDYMLAVELKPGVILLMLTQPWILNQDSRLSNELNLKDDHHAGYWQSSSRLALKLEAGGRAES